MSLTLILSALINLFSLGGLPLASHASTLETAGHISTLETAGHISTL